MKAPGPCGHNEPENNEKKSNSGIVSLFFLISTAGESHISHVRGWLPCLGLGFEIANGTALGRRAGRRSLDAECSPGAKNKHTFAGFGHCLLKIGIFLILAFFAHVAPFQIDRQ
jgi:hypothetical protein